MLGGRAGGMPELVFEYILKQHGLEPEKDVSIDQSIDFGSTAAAFSGGQGEFTIEFEPHATALEKKGDGYVVASLGEEIDQSIDFGSTAAAFSGGQGEFTIEFEPHATALEKKGDGYVVASLGEDSGYVPYTAFSAKKSYIEKHPDVIQAFVNALQKGMDYVAQHSPEEIADAIAPQFKETDMGTLTAIVKRYYEQDTWKENLIFEENAFVLLQDILEEGGELKERVPYEKLVDTKFAKKAVEK